MTQDAGLTADEELDLEGQAVEVQRFSQQDEPRIEGNFFQDTLIVTGHIENLRVGALFKDLNRDFTSGQIGHDDIRNQQMDVAHVFLGDHHGMDAAERLQDGVALLREHQREQFAQDILIFGD